MAYVFLGLAIVLECAGTYCMKLSDGFSHLWASVACIALMGFCFFFLSKALTGIPLSIVYATWGAVGIALATAISIFIFKEPANLMLFIGIALAIAGIVIVNLANAH